MKWLITVQSLRNMTREKIECLKNLLSRKEK